MAKNYPPFINAVEKNDPELHKVVTELFDISMAPGELDAKTKVLIALAIDAFANSPEGVKYLSRVARQMGVSNGQIAEVLRIAYQVAGNKTLAATLAAFEE